MTTFLSFTKPTISKEKPRIGRIDNKAYPVNHTIYPKTKNPK